MPASDAFSTQLCVSVTSHVSLRLFDEVSSAHGGALPSVVEPAARRLVNNR